MYCVLIDGSLEQSRQGKGKMSMLAENEDFREIGSAVGNRYIRETKKEVASKIWISRSIGQRSYRVASHCHWVAGKDATQYRFLCYRRGTETAGKGSIRIRKDEKLRYVEERKFNLIKYISELGQASVQTSAPTLTALFVMIDAGDCATSSLLNATVTVH